MRSQNEFRYCSQCIWSSYIKGPSILSRGFICKRNPFKPVIMGMFGKCSDREENKREQYSKPES